MTRENIREATRKQTLLAFKLYKEWLSGGWGGRPYTDQEISKCLFDTTSVLYLRRETDSKGRIMLAYYRGLSEKGEPFDLKTWIPVSGRFFRKGTIYRWEKIW